MCYPDGVIKKKNTDGTYVVEYDGDKVEKDVKATRLALPPDSSGTGNEGKSNDGM